MAPEKRERKKTVKFDPHPPGSKHKMMSERSKNVKEKKDARIRMQKLRKADKEGGNEAAAAQSAPQDDTEDNDQDASKEGAVEQNCDKK